MKKILVFVLALVLCLTATACKKEEAKAHEVLEAYIQNIQSGSYQDAYDLLSDFDKMNITQEEFTQWRELVAEVQETQEYSINTKVDTFKNYEYKGAKYKKAYGYLITQKLDKHIDVETSNCDGEEYHIMVGQQDGEWEIALLIIDLTSLTDQIRRKIDEAKADQE